MAKKKKKNPPANARDVSSTPGLGRTPGEGNGNPLQYACLENPMDRRVWRAMVHRVVKSWTWLKWFSIHTLWCCLEKTPESPLGSKEFKPVNPKRNQLWVFTGRTDAEAESPVLWPHDAKSQLIGEDPDAGKDWGKENKGVTEDEMVGLHHWFNAYKFEQTQGDSEGQGSLECCSP